MLDKQGMVQFDLLINPFVILGLTAEANVWTITERARELATADSAAASRQLLVPRTRLHAELGHLPGASQELVDASINALKLGREPDLRPLTQLARANVLAHLAARGMATARHLHDLAELQDTNRFTTAQIIGAAREQSRMPPVSKEMLDTALETIASRHEGAFAKGMLALPTGANLFAEELHAAAPNASSRASFLRQATTAWDRAIASDAARDLESAASIEATLRDHPDPEAARQLAAIVLRFASRTNLHERRAVSSVCRMRPRRMPPKGGERSHSIFLRPTVE